MTKRSEEWRILNPIWKNSPSSLADPVSSNHHPPQVSLTGLRWVSTDPTSGFGLPECLLNHHHHSHPLQADFLGGPRTLGGQSCHSGLSLFSRWVLISASANESSHHLPCGDSKQIQINTSNFTALAGQKAGANHISFGLRLMLTCHYGFVAFLDWSGFNNTMILFFEAEAIVAHQWKPLSTSPFVLSALSPTIWKHPCFLVAITSWAWLNFSCPKMQGISGNSSFCFVLFCFLQWRVKEPNLGVSTVHRAKVPVSPLLSYPREIV